VACPDDRKNRRPDFNDACIVGDEPYIGVDFKVAVGCQKLGSHRGIILRLTVVAT
jgi:hypothetical protein